MMELTEEQLDTLKELINIGIGRAAGALNEMLNEHVQLQVPAIEIFTPDQLKPRIASASSEKLSAVRLVFRGPFSGVASLVFPSDSALKLVNILIDEDPEDIDLDMIRIGTLSEVGNIVINGVMGTISNIMAQQLNYSLPTYHENTLDSLLTPAHNSYNYSTVLLAQTRFIIKNLQIIGDLFLLFELGSFNLLIQAVDHIIQDTL